MQVKWRWCLPVALVVVLAGAGTGLVLARRPNSAPPAAGGVVGGSPGDPSTSSRSAVVAEVDDHAPIVSLDINGGQTASVGRGWPIVVRARLLRAQAAGASTVIAGRAGGWPSRVALRIAGPPGVPPPSFTLVSPPSGDLVLDGQMAGELAWVLAPDESAKLGAGTYTLVAVLDINPQPESAAGNARVESRPVRFDVREPPAAGTVADESERHQVMADYHAARGDSAQAAAEIDRLLDKQPNHVAALTAKADRYAADGRSREALDLYNRAAAAFALQHPGAGPPLELLRRRTAVFWKAVERERP